MAKREFDFQGLDEFKKDLNSVINKYPDEADKEVYRLAGVWTKDVNSKMPSEYNSGKRPLTKSWHRAREKSLFGGYTVGVEITNTAPHWHLVENGHEVKADPAMYAAYKAGRLDSSKKSRTGVKKKGNVKKLGWAPGKNYALKTRAEWDGGRFSEYVDAFLKKMIKEHNL